MPVLIGITAGEIYNKDETWAPITHGQPKTYTEPIIAAEGVPLILPITDDESALRGMYDSVDGLLLAGGNDINPELYDQELHETTKDVSTYRDQYEKQLIEWALADKKPILGICRGMQLLNVVCGGSLHQHIPNNAPKAEDHTISSVTKDVEHLAHTLNIEPASNLARFLGASSIRTNTHHHQAINQLSPKLEAVAWSEDGIIEAVESRDYPYLIGVQSHPESLVERAEPAWLNLFVSFVQAAKNQSST